MGPLSPSRRPHCGCCRGQEDCDGLCVAGYRRSPCPGRRPGAGHGQGARGGAAAITAQPLPPGSSSLPLVAARSISSPLGCGVRPLPGNLLASTLRGGDGFGGYPASYFPCGGLYQGLGLNLIQGVQSLHFVFFRSVFDCFFLFLLPYPRLSVWVLPYTTSSSTTLSWLNPALRIRVVSVAIKASEQLRDL